MLTLYDNRLDTVTKYCTARDIAKILSINPKHIEMIEILLQHDIWHGDCKKLKQKFSDENVYVIVNSGVLERIYENFESLNECVNVFIHK